MPLNKWPLVAVQLALLATPSLAQSLPPAVPVPAIGTAPLPSQPISATPAPAPAPAVAAAPSPAPAIPPGPAGVVAARPPGLPPAPPVPGAPTPPAIPGIPGLSGPIAALVAPEAKPVRVLGDDEAEIPRAEYKARLVACLSFSARCRFPSLTEQDQDYLRYEMRGQRFSGTVVEEIAVSRMQQFLPLTTPMVIVPKLAEHGRGAAPTKRVTEIENRSDADGYAIAVTLPHADARASAPVGRSRQAPRRAVQAAPDWW